MDIRSYQPYYIFVSDFSDREIRLSEQMKFAQTVEPPTITYPTDRDDREAFTIRTPGEVLISDSTPLMAR